MAVGSLLISPPIASVLLAILVAVLMYRLSGAVGSRLIHRFTLTQETQLYLALVAFALFFVWAKEPVEDLIYHFANYGESPRNRWISWHEYKNDAGEYVLLVEYQVRQQRLSTFLTTIELGDTTYPLQIGAFLAEPRLAVLDDSTAIGRVTETDNDLKLISNAPYLQMRASWIDITPQTSLYVRIIGSTGVVFKAASFGERFELSPSGIRPIALIRWWQNRIIMKYIITGVLALVIVLQIPRLRYKPVTQHKAFGQGASLVDRYPD